MVTVQRRLHAHVQAPAQAALAVTARERAALPLDRAERASPARELHQERAAPAPRGDVRNAPARAPYSEARAAAEEQRFHAIAENIRETREYQKLSAEDRAVAEEIIAKAKTKADPVYYGEKLLLLFNTAEAPEEETAVQNLENAQASVEATQERLATPEGKANKNLEEKASRDRSRRWTGIQGVGARFSVDREDPNQVVVKMKVHLTGKKEDVASIKAMEDDIEKHASTRGYTFDLEFSKTRGADVFEAGVDPTGWTTASNWIGSSDEIAHEAHHRLGLDDRYDYIESHADNADMKIPARLHWFNVQIDKPRDPAGANSLMGDGAKLLHDDVCNVVKLDQTCVEAREKRLGAE